MLVLSRKKDQQILFPNLGIEVQIHRIAGNSVSVGINAPKSVRILRGELADNPSDAPSISSDVGENKRLHELRNQLNKAQLAVAIAQKQLELGREQDVEETLQKMVNQLSEIDQKFHLPETSSKSSIDSSRSFDSDGPMALIVEDDANERALLAGYLRLCGYTISEASDGVDAIEYLKTNQVELIVLDMHMPRMNGMETVEAIRRLPSLHNTKVVVVSGEDRQESMVTKDNRGVSEWFSKPLNPDRLVSYLDAARN